MNVPVPAFLRQLPVDQELVEKIKTSSPRVIEAREVLSRDYGAASQSVRHSLIELADDFKALEEYGLKFAELIDRTGECYVAMFDDLCAKALSVRQKMIESHDLIAENVIPIRNTTDVEPLADV